MGAKWWPAFLWVVDVLPLTGSGKVDKAPLRQAAWHTHDPVFVRIGRTPAYQPFTRDDRDALELEFAEHGRTAHLPVPAADRADLE